MFLATHISQGNSLLALEGHVQEPDADDVATDVSLILL